MKLCCCYTPAHEQLFRDYFLPSVEQSTFELTASFLDIAGTGNFLAQDFLDCIRRKLALIEASIESHTGEIIVWADVDIVFSGEVKSVVNDLFGKDRQLKLLFQREGHHLPDVNTGFIAIRCDEETREFFRDVSSRLNREPSKNEQAVVNDLLQAGTTIRWEYLPWTFYARTHGWPPPRTAILYHANYTKGTNGVGQKIDQLREYLAIRQSEWRRIWSCLKRVPGKLRAKFIRQALS